MSDRRASITAGCFAAIAIAAVGCTDDFDALFTGGAADAGSGAPDSGAGTGDAGAEAAADAAPSCPDGAGTCICAQGATCNSSCDVDGECTANANRDSKLTYECQEHVDKCTVVCDHANCDVRCDAEGACSLRCGEDATCVLRCTARPNSCDLICNDAVKKDCGSGVFTCSPTCP